MSMWDEYSVDVLQSKTLIKIESNNNDELIFWCNDGTKYKMHHEQD